MKFSAYPDTLKTINRQLVFSSVLYVSYNQLAGHCIHVQLLPYLKTKGSPGWEEYWEGAFYYLLPCDQFVNLIFTRLHLRRNADTCILKGFSSSAGNLYAVILWLAMLTSAVTSGFCLTTG